jgi:hypothetical protein
MLSLMFRSKLFGVLELWLNTQRKAEKQCLAFAEAQEAEKQP